MLIAGYDVHSVIFYHAVNKLQQQNPCPALRWKWPYFYAHPLILLHESTHAHVAQYHRPSGMLAVGNLNTHPISQT
jgi:hypothetical protein